MNIRPFIDSVKSSAHTSYSTGKTAAIWLGHKLTLILDDYVIPTISLLSSVALKNFRAFNDFAKVNLGMALVISGLCLVASFGAYELANNNELLRVTKCFWEIVGFSAFLCAAGATGATLAVVAV